MNFLEFMKTPISSSDFISHLNLVQKCNFIKICDSPFFCKANYSHFGINHPEDLLREPPDESCVIMCRFRDGELEKIINQCAHKKFRYVVVQTLIGDDGFVSLDTLKKLPKNIVKIYSKNVHYFDPKLIPIPIGRDWRVTSENFSQVFIRENLDSYINLVYMNFSLETNLSVRQQAYQLFYNKNWVTTEMPKKYGSYDLTHGEFCQQMYQHKFCLSPTGRALDCYRTWDALFSKSIPIVDKNFHNQFYSDLPLILVNNLQQITYDFLCKNFDVFLSKNFNFEKLTAKYWSDLLREDLNILY